jgi:tetratricopeptide (TPR) repeat protein
MCPRAMSLVVVSLTLLMAAACSPAAAPARPAGTAVPGPPAMSGTSRVELAQTIAAMDAHLGRSPEDPAATIRLADALLRQTRVTGNAGLASRAEAALRAVLRRDTDHYDARRMLAAVLLSQHRFREAQREAERCVRMNARDAWPYGVLTDAHIELGEYDAAFDAVDRMVAMQPDAASYARASYARELQGDLDHATTLMAMALEATPPSDVEAVAWHHAQLGHLLLARGRVADAAREYDHAQFVFPAHPLALEGRARVLLARGQPDAAAPIVTELVETAPSPAALALAGDVFAALGRQAEAERHYLLAEAAWQSDAPEPARLALFLADRGRRPDEAVRIARQAAAERHDIFTADALAWACFKAGRIDEAVAASARAMRTGIRDRAMRERAAAIARGAAALGPAAVRRGAGQEQAR